MEGFVLGLLRVNESVKVVEYDIFIYNLGNLFLIDDFLFLNQTIQQLQEERHYKNVHSPLEASLHGLKHLDGIEVMPLSNKQLSAAILFHKFVMESLQSNITVFKRIHKYFRLTNLEELIKKANHDCKFLNEIV